MPDFIRGQRWINDARLEMGLGTVIATDRRTVTLIFHTAEETLTYASENAPLTRVRFARGDHVTGNDETSLKIESVKERDGLLSYIGRDQSGNQLELHETELNHQMQLNRPAERLFFGQIDDSKWFDLRYRTLLQLNRLAVSDLRSLTGCRTSLIPHQLYIAHEVANRYAPRVLLADEVGLGKTIEAGLILHHQLITERAHRILIIVPESLQFQWLLEMQRRFNLSFKIFDEGRCTALEESTLDASLDSGTLANPFHTEQLVLCSLEFLSSQPERALQCLDGDWDLLVVDEAHHLQWSPQGSSPQYQMIEALAAVTKSVLLLTATPEQLGKASHFARLRLLDPDRFPDFDAFIKEEADYEQIATAVEQLQESEKPDQATLQLLQEMVPEGDNQHYLQTLQSAHTGSDSDLAARSALIEHLLDRHGTGRVLFRNTRAAVKGFPRRQVLASELPLPAEYRASIKEAVAADIKPQNLLTPELLYQSVKRDEQPQWTQVDPRIHWLIELLRNHKPEKFLVIASTAATAIDLVQALMDQAGIHAALFHEGLSLVERDRAAAFFADRESGAQLLVCSEIGSEGRNFQFARHMVLFDLPLNPDLLEQRIGRLDRIGQSSRISIHIPILLKSAQQRLFRWYDEGLDAFEHYSGAANAVYAKLKTELFEALQQHSSHLDGIMNELIDATRTTHQQLKQQMHRGRNLLLEYNSCRPRIADNLKQRAQKQHQHSDLADYMESIFDCFGIDTEDESQDYRIIRPGREMLSGGFPGLPDDGMTLTYDREEALANEDIQFLSWDHPLVSGAMELISSSELGNCAFTAVKYSGAARGSLLMESLYTLDTASTDQLQGSRYLPPTVIRVVVDEDGESHSQRLSHTHLLNNQLPIARETAAKVIRAKEKILREMAHLSRQQGRALAPEIISSAHQHAHTALNREIHRLQALSQINPSVRPEEIHFYEQLLETVTTILGSASMRLEAVRVLVAI